MSMKADLRHGSAAKKYGLTAVAVWTLFIVGMLVWGFDSERNNVIEQARVEARAIWSHNLSYRKWVTEMGGVYVNTDRMKPNPYLKTRDRDKKTTDGVDLTMANPAYMTGQVFDIIRKESDQPIINRIVSDKYLNPANKPDEWEKNALRVFEGGTKEVSELALIEGRPYMRLFKPMTTVEGCLKCHGDQGYKIGDIRGGISVAVPMAPYYKIESVTKTYRAIIYLFIWGVGAGAIIFYNVRLHKEQLSILESEEKYRALIESANDAVFIHEIKDDGSPGPFIEVNELACRQLGYSREELIGLSPVELDDPLYRGRIAEAMQQLIKEGQTLFEAAQMTKDGLSIPMEVSTRLIEIRGKRLLFSIVRNITERKQAEEAIHLQAVELEEEVAERQMAQESLQEKALLLEEEIEKRQEAQEELERLNAELELRVHERTTELEEKNAELYKMNRLFVGRELKMVDLKERIRALEGKPSL